ncbi:MAG TPA: glycosyltransferase family A protein [Micromonosporaceae bacterium]
MKVSCILPTFNRPPAQQWLLEEAVESFLRQDYADKELVLLNDCPAQHLVCDAPGVTVVNLPRRFQSLGEKRNAAVGLAGGDVLMPWDDDDISLPWRLSASAAWLGDADYFCPSQYWVADAAGLHSDSCRSLAHGCSAFTRDAFDAVGGYPHLSFGEDAAFDDKLRAAPSVDVVPAAPLPTDRWYYVYRWGVSPVHMSSRGPERDWYGEIGRRSVEPGRFVLRPHWREDYVRRSREALRTDSPDPRRGGS